MISMSQAWDKEKSNLVSGAYNVSQARSQKFTAALILLLQKLLFLFSFLTP